MAGQGTAARAAVRMAAGKKVEVSRAAGERVTEGRALGSVVKAAVEEVVMVVVEVVMVRERRAAAAMGRVEAHVAAATRAGAGAAVEAWEVQMEVAVAGVVGVGAF